MSALSEPVIETRSSPPPERCAADCALRAVEAGLLTVAAIFLALHFVHLRADFPNHSPWMDWSKYTDEGWYGDAAIRHFQRGHWNLPGDFNPAAALPVWPLIEAALFRVTGVSLTVARALTGVVFGLILMGCYLLIRRWSNAGVEPQSASKIRATSSVNASATALQRRPLAPAIAVVLLAVSPFCFAFMRLAILEPLLILLTLAALLAATAAGRAGGARWVAWSAALGSLLVLMVLTKTTGVFLSPAIFWMLWAANGYRWRDFLRMGAVSCGVGAALWGGYFGLVVRPRYLLDYRYLFSANTYTGVTYATLWQVLQSTVMDGSWIGKTLSALSAVALVGSLGWLCVRRGRVNPLLGALLLWVFGYAAFLAYHDNLQPRYYMVLAVPLTMLVAVVFDAALGAAWARAAGIWTWMARAATVVCGGALAFVVVHGGAMTVGFVLHPEYTWLSAAEQIRAAVDRDHALHPEHSRLLLSISGSDLSLMTGLPSICDDFGTMELADRVAAYKPGWFATWNDVEDDKMDALTPTYHLERVLAVPAFDDPERNLLVLYRLDPSGQAVARARRRRSAPRRLRTKIGEQPSPEQLRH